MKTKRGFTLVEILLVVVILGVLAAIAVPHFTESSNEAKTTNLCSTLQMMRLQIELYRTQHNGTNPSLADFEAQMTGTTDITGDTSGTDFGPYFRSIPIEPFSNSNTTTAGDASGWNYNEITGMFWAPYDPSF